MSFGGGTKARRDGAPEAIETYHYNARRRVIERRIRRREDRASHVGMLDIVGGSGPLADRHDLSWLRAPSPPLQQSKVVVTIADLFSGCGGLSLGFAEGCRAMGVRAEHTLAVEQNEVAAAVFAKNFVGADVRVAPIEHLVDQELGLRLSRREQRLRSALSGLDVLLAGPPCQGHSDLNNHTRRNDPKNALYLRAIRFAEVTRPRLVIIENVPGVVHDRSGVLDTATASLTARGYHVSSAVLNAEQFGVPQRRRRHVLVGSLDDPNTLDEVKSLRLPERPVTWAIGDLLGRGSEEVFDSPACHALVNERRMRYLFERDVYDLPDRERPDCHRLKSHSYGAVYGRMFPDRPAPTITAGFGSTGQGRFVHPYEPRTLTPHEAARVQGFPDFFDFSSCRGRRALQQMIGNAVPPRLAYALAITLLR